MSRIALSLVIPCYNEGENLRLLISRLAETFDRDDVEVILVDNGSSDQSSTIIEQALARHAFLRLLRVEVNEGYGNGIVAGLREARGKYLGWSHADMQTDPHDALRALAIIEEEETNCENLYVKGRRYGRPLADTVFTLGMSMFESALFRAALWDINAQPTIFPRSFFETWQDPPKDFSLDLFSYVMAIRQGLGVRRFPVHFGERAHGRSHWNVDWRSKIKFIRRTVHFSTGLARELRRRG